MRPPYRPCSMTSPRSRSDPDASMKTSVAGVGPNMNGTVPCRRASSSHRSASREFTTCAAPNCWASSSRRGLVSTATTSRMPLSASVAMARSPIGPQPSTATRSPGAISPWFTACMPTAAGSVKGGDTQLHLVGYREQPSPLGRLADEEERREAAFGRATAQPAQFLVGWMHDDPVAGCDAVHLAAGPLDHAGHLVAQRHGSPGDAAHVHEGDIGATDPTCRHADEGVTRAGRRRGDVVEANVVGTVDPDLLHRPVPLQSSRTLRSPTGPQYAVPVVSATASDRVGRWRQTHSIEPLPARHLAAAVVESIRRRLGTFFAPRRGMNCSDQGTLGSI